MNAIKKFLSVFNINTWADVRAILYVAAPVAAGILVSYGVIDNSTAPLWIAFVLALAPASLAALHTADGLRAWIYTIAGAVNGLLVAYDAAGAADLSAWLPIVSGVIGGGSAALAAANTNTSRA